MFLLSSDLHVHFILTGQRPATVYYCDVSMVTRSWRGQSSAADIASVVVSTTELSARSAAPQQEVYVSAGFSLLPDWLRHQVPVF